MSRSSGRPAFPWRAAIDYRALRGYLRLLTPAERAVFVVNVCQIALRAGTTTVGAWCGLLGLSILAGGEARLSGPQFTYAIMVMPWWAWSIVPLLAGHVLIFGVVHRGLVVPAASICAVWGAVWTVVIAEAIHLTPNATVTSAVSYGILTLLLIGTALTHGFIELAARTGREASDVRAEGEK